MKATRRDPKLSSLAPTRGIQGEKVTHSCPTKENLSIHCQAKEFQILQTGELMRPYQQHPAPPQAGASGQVMVATGLVLLQVERGFILLSFDIFLFLSMPVKTCTPNHHLVYFVLGRTFGESMREMKKRAKWL